MTKTYVLDTNVLIQAPYALQCFEDNNIILPVAVLEELDNLKIAEGETGANARQAIRYLEQLRGKGNLTEGVSLPEGGILRLEINHINEPLPQGFKEEKNDNRILKVCKGVQKTTDNVILITKDIVVRIKAQLMGITAEDFTTEQAPVAKEQYTGRMDVYAVEDKFSNFKKKGIDSKDVYELDENGERKEVHPVLNQFFLLSADQSTKKTQLGRFDGERIVPLRYKKTMPFGVKPRNVGQYFLQEALMEDADKAPLVIVKGMAGTAKTFYSLAVGLEKVMEDKDHPYRKIIISRPNAQFDDDIGFLPGDEQEKIAPLIRPAIDNLELLVDQDEKERFANENELSGKIAELFEREIILPQAMNFIRGRSITQSYLIIDEAQNLTPKQAKGIITRAGKGTKVILLGDPNQIDNPLLDERTNGLSYAAEKMKNSPYCYQITLSPEECERSALAMDAIKRFD
ncbi:MAG: PhoH family protein [Lachnospiraceae bacterium]|nr:PhoH family protein [Lachnospiraceae bacterium]